MRGEEFRRRFTESARSRDQLLHEVLAVLVKKARLLGRRLSITDDADHEDAVHAVLARLLDGDWQSLKPELDVYGYLYIAVRNEFFSLLRSRKPMVDIAASDAEDPAADGGDPTDRLAMQGDHLHSELVLSIESTCLGKAYAALAAEPAHPGQLRTVDLLDHLALADSAPTSEELARFLGTTEGAARERKSQALKRLRRKCLELCGDDTCRE